MGFLEELDQEMRQQPKPKINSGCLLISCTLFASILWSMIYAGNGDWQMIVVAVIISILVLVGVVKQIKEIKNLFK